MKLARNGKAALRAATGLLLLALLHHAGGLAQETPEQPEAAGDEVANSQPVEEPTPEPAPASSEDPFDYEATEQISEDLSVSFPVDI